MCFMKITDKDVSALAKDLMAERGMTRRELARRMEKAHSRIDDKINGKFSWKVEDLYSLASAFGVSVSWFADELERRAQTYQVD